MTAFDFGDGNGSVPAHKHPNGGGWVADTAHVDDTAYVADTAKVYGNAQVFENAYVADTAKVSGKAVVSGYAHVFGNVHVSGSAIVEDVFPVITRSDGYCFAHLPCEDGKKRILAGCRYFTMEEAEKHWKETRGGTPLGDETMEILKFFKRMDKK